MSDEKIRSGNVWSWKRQTDSTPNQLQRQVSSITYKNKPLDSRNTNRHTRSTTAPEQQTRKDRNNTFRISETTSKMVKTTTAENGSVSSEPRGYRLFERGVVGIKSISTAFRKKTTLRSIN